MKVICTQENLKTGLLTVGRIISSSNSLPILGNVLIKTENGLLKLLSTNLEIAITTHVRCKIEEEGEMTVMCKTITDLVNNLPNKNIVLSNSNGHVAIETENYHTSIKTLPAEEFPLIPEIESQESLVLDAQEFKNSLDQVVFAASNNQTQPEMSGVLMDMEKNILKLAATDRYRLAEKKLALQKPWTTPQQVIVPQRTILEISRIIGGQKGNITIIFSDTQISLRFNDTQVISRVVDGQYPEYKQIIPSNFATQILTKKQPFINALKTAGIFSQSTNSVKLEYKEAEQVLVLNTESQEVGKSEVKLESRVEGKSGQVILNHKYVLDCLNAMESDNVVMKIIDDSSPSLITPESKDDYLYLVMPIKS